MAAGVGQAEMIGIGWAVAPGESIGLRRGGAGGGQIALVALDLGEDIAGVLTGSAPKSPTDAFFFYHYDELQAVRVGNWKYIRKTNLYIWPIPLDAEVFTAKFGANQLGSDRLPLLYDLTLDPGEKYNVLGAYPDIAEKMDRLMRTWEAQNEKNPRGFAALAR